MKKIPAHILRQAWIAGVQAKRKFVMKTETKKNKNWKPPTFWRKPSKLFDSEQEAGIRAAAQVILDWSLK